MLVERGDDVNMGQIYFLWERLELPVGTCGTLYMKRNKDNLVKRSLRKSLEKKS